MKRRIYLRMKSLEEARELWFARFAASRQWIRVGGTGPAWLSTRNSHPHGPGRANTASHAPSAGLGWNVSVTSPSRANGAMPGGQ